MTDCIFCKIIAGEIPSYKVYENEYVYAFFDIFPAAKYHTLVIPKKHTENIYDISEHDLQQVITIVKKIAELYKEKLDIKHVQILNNNGKQAQQEVMHIHYHIIPRSIDDGNVIKLTSHPERQEEFTTMLQKLQ